MMAMPNFIAQALDQFNDLRLDGHIQRSGRLVSDQDLRIAGERHGNHHTLAHAARKLVRIILEAVLGLGDAHHPEQLSRAFARLLFVHPHMKRKRLFKLATDGEHRIQRGHWVLKDHADLGTADMPDLIVGHLEQILPSEYCFPGIYLSGRRWDQAKYREHGDTFAATAFPHNTKRLPFLQGKGDAIYCMNNPIRCFKLCFKTLHIKEQIGHSAIFLCSICG